MHVFVINLKKRNIPLIIIGIAFIFLCVFLLSHAFAHGSLITIGYRLSLKVPQSIEMNAVHMAVSNNAYAQTVSVTGSKLKTETIKRNGFSEITFQYPETLRMGEIQELGHEITVHVSFRHKDNNMAGFFQVWNLNQPFKEFINNSKKLSSMTFTEFSEKSIKIQGMDAILWEYVYITRTQEIKGIEVFIGNGSEMYRFSAFAPKDDYKSQYKSIILRMAKSLKIKNTSGAVLTSVKKPWYIHIYKA